MANSPQTLSELVRAERGGEVSSEETVVQTGADREALLLAEDQATAEGRSGPETAPMVDLYPDPYTTYVYGTEGNDHIHAENGWHLVYGGGGDDIIEAAGGTMYGEDGNDILYASPEGNDLHGGAGNDRLVGNSGYDWLYGEEGDDVLHGGGNRDIIDGGDGNDELHGDGGDDRIFGGNGHDLIFGGDGDDTLSSADDFGVTGNSREIYGEDGDDYLVGGRSGTSLLDGGIGSDTLVGGDGVDTMKGGAGNDVYRFVNADDRVIEEAGGGMDTVYAAQDIVLSDNVENLVLYIAARNGTGNDLANRITIDTCIGVTVHGGGGDDVIIASEGILAGLVDGNFRDRLYGDAGNDTLIGDENGYDTLAGGTGDDTYVLTAETDTLVEARNEGSDTVKAGFSYTLLDHFEKLVLTGDGAINGTGNGVDNALTGNGKANTLSGLGGDDALYGGAGEDTLLGGRGKDWLDGGYGHDTLTGGAGADVFSFGAGFSKDEGMVSGGMLSASSDLVLDFVQGEDRIALSLKTFASLAKAGVTVGGALTADLFVKGAYARDANDYLLYDARTGQLWYDANGNLPENGWTGKRLIATFTDKDGLHPVLSAADFQFVA